jgi:hypothetical protein
MGHEVGAIDCKVASCVKRTAKNRDNVQLEYALYLQVGNHPLWAHPPKMGASGCTTLYNHCAYLAEPKTDEAPTTTAQNFPQIPTFLDEQEHFSPAQRLGVPKRPSP